MLTPDDKKLISEFVKSIHWLKSQQLKNEKKNWVKVSKIKELTGMNKEELRRARKSGAIEMKKDQNGIWYNLNTVPDHLKKAS